MKPQWRLIAVMAWLCILPFAGFSQKVTLSVTDGELIRCISDSTVEVSLEPNPTKTLDRMELYWEEESEEPVVIRPGDSYDLAHTYSLFNLMEQCEYDCRGNNGFCIRIEVFAYYAGGQSEDENKSVVLTFKTPPQPQFDPFFTCIDSEVTIGNTTCPSNDINMEYEWDFGGIQTSTEESPTISFREEGTFPVTLSATNLCGTETTTRSVNVIAPAEAAATPDLNITDTVGTNSYLICGQGRTNTRLIASNSPNATQFNWRGSSGVSFPEGRNDDTVYVEFNGPGNYTVTLEVDNNCRQPGTADFAFAVVEAQSLSLQSVPDVCNELSYTPDPLLQEATYAINGTAYAAADFPVDLAPSNVPYIVEARLVNPCGEQVRYDTFSVVVPEQVEITGPAADTSLCENNPPVVLSASIPGGSWQRDDTPANDVFDPQTFGPGIYTMTYTVGEGNCRTRDERTIEVVAGPQLDVGGDASVCIDAGPVALSANENGGVWSGEGVTDSLAGTFDPARVGPGAYRLTYSFERPGDGCRSSAEKEIQVVDLPQVNLPDSTLVCDSEEAIALAPLLNPSLNPGGGALNWSGPGVTGGAFATKAAGGTGVYDLVLRYEIEPGCSRSDTIAARVEALTQAAAIPDTTLCTNQGTFVLQGTPAGGAWFDSRGQLVDPALDLDDLGAGAQMFEYVLSRGTSCESRAQTTITLIAADGLQAGDDLYVCESEAQLALPARNAQWSGPALQGERQVDVAALGVGTYTYTLTDASLPPACNSDQLDVVVSSLPTPVFSPDSTGCVGAPLSMNNTTSGADTYRWNFGDGTRDAGEDPDHTYRATGSYTIEMEAISLNPLTNEELCSASSSGQVRIYEPPERVDFEPQLLAGCSPLTIDFANESLGERLTFNWDFGNGENSSDVAPQNVEFTAELYDTTYAVRLSVANGCGNSDAVDSITVFAQPTARFATEVRASYCSGEEVSIGHRSLADSLVWELGDGSVYLGEEPPVQQYFTGPDRNDTIRLQLWAYNECGVDTAQQDLVIIPTDARADISVLDDEPCQGDTVLLESLSRPLDARVEWILPDGSRREGLRVPVVFDEAGLQMVTAKVYSCGLDSTDLALNVQPRPSAQLTAPAFTCPGETVSVRLETDAIPGVLQIDSMLFPGRDQVNWSFDSLGTYRITGEARTTEGCQTSVSTQIQVQPGPEALAAAADSVCVGEPVSLRSQSTGVSSCAWVLSDGTRYTGCSAEHVFAEAGLQSSRLMVTSSIGCRDSIDRPIFVRTTPVADFDLDVVESCTPALIRVTNRSQLENSISWTWPDGSSSAAEEAVFTQPEAGTFPVRLLASRDDICFDETVREFTAFASPMLEVTKEQECTQEAGFTVRVDVAPEAALQLNGPGYSAEGSLHTGLQPGDYLLTAETPNGCVVDTITNIPAVNELTASIEADSFRVELGEAIPLQVDVNQADAVVAWLPGDVFDDPASLNPVARPLQSGDLIASVTDGRGCVVRDTVFVEVAINRERGIFIPNAFTPTGDGVNDVFMVRSSNPGLAEVAYMRIYGPGGDLVFQHLNGQPNDVQHGWDGRFREKEAQAGNYVYVIELLYVDGERIQENGTLTLIR